jgi:hypothetical protein
MHSAIRACLADIYLPVKHSQTYAALERLIPGSENPADVLLAVKYYDETLKDAEDRGAELVITPIAKEGLVFILNKANPVSSLTQQQLRDIYSGKTTNWKEVGGKDEAIIPYTRNWDSGSHTAMETFMAGESIDGEDSEPIIGHTDTVIFGMGEMLSQVQRAGSPGIGYNIFSWSMKQNLESFGLKTVVVDGVAANNETIADSTYPLMVYTYSYYNEGNAKGAALTDWLLSAEGQRIITSAGYVGIDGDLWTDPMPDFYKDDYLSAEETREYYKFYGIFVAWGSVFFHSEFVADQAQTEKLANGKSKAVTVLRVASFEDYAATERSFKRFIVLTREKGGGFAVINEGPILSYNDGVIVTG